MDSRQILEELSMEQHFDLTYGCEGQRLLFLVKRDGADGALDFAKRTYAVYRKNLLLKRRVLDARGMQDRKESFVTRREYRRSFIESCVGFRAYIAENAN